MGKDVREKGMVKWFSNAKGYGFIEREGGSGEDIFVHYSAVAMDGYRSLEEGQKVELSVVKSGKGLCAETVTVIE